MLEEINLIYTQSLDALEDTRTTEDLEDWYRETLGRKGRVTLMTRQVGSLSAEDRP